MAKKKVVAPVTETADLAVEVATPAVETEAASETETATKGDIVVKYHRQDARAVLSWYEAMVVSGTRRACSRQGHSSQSITWRSRANSVITVK
jgi:hypothetical protein